MLYFEYNYNNKKKYSLYDFYNHFIDYNIDYKNNELENKIKVIK